MLNDKPIPKYRIREKIPQEVDSIADEKLVKKLKEKGIEVRHRYREPLYKQELLQHKMAYPRNCPFSCPYYGKEVDYSSVYLPAAEKVAGTVVGLPNHPYLTKQDLETIVDVFHSLEVVT